MIICHCNRISDADIRGALVCLKAKCPGAEVCARRVYGELGKCPKCCNCLSLAEKTISNINLDQLQPGAANAGENGVVRLTG